MSCPLLYRFRVVDRLPERPSAAATRGTVVHKVLEDLFDLPASERTAERAREMVAPSWEALLADEPELAELFTAVGGAVDAETTEETTEETTDGAASLADWLAECRGLLGRYFQIEDPVRLQPAEREVHVETTLDSGLSLHGYIDRMDVNTDGDVRIVDYKTGRSPDRRFEARALFQMKFYALVLWRTRGVIPRVLTLIYLGNSETVSYAPDEADLRSTERKVEALWSAIQRATNAGDWRPRPSALCAWCDHKPICPAWGGTPPPLPSTEAG